MAYWIFKFNPEKYRLADRLADPNPLMTWTVTRYRDQVAPGDTVFLWETGPNRGIRAVLKIEEPPRDMPEWESEQVYWVEPDRDVRCRAVASITHRNIEVEHTLLKETPGLENLSVFHGFQQTSNFVVTPEEGRIIEGLIRG